MPGTVQSFSDPSFDFPLADLGKLGAAWQQLVDLRRSQISPPQTDEKISLDNKIWSTLAAACDLGPFNAPDVSFAIMVPVHNDEKCLRRFIHSLSVASLPSGARIFMIFATNGCSDNSAEIIREYLKKQGDDFSLPAIMTADDEIRSVHAVKGRDVVYMHVDIAPANKANATYHVHRLSRSLGLEYVHNLDADTMIEPFTFAEMWCSAVTAFKSPQNVMVQGEISFIQPDGSEADNPYRCRADIKRAANCIGINLAWRADEFMEKVWDRVRYLSAEDTLAHWLVEAYNRKLFFGISNVFCAAQNGFHDAVKSHCRNTVAIREALLCSKSWTDREREFFKKRADSSVIALHSFWQRARYYFNLHDSSESFLARVSNRLFHWAASELGLLLASFRKRKQGIVEWPKTFQRW